MRSNAKDDRCFSPVRRAEIAWRAALACYYINRWKFVTGGLSILDTHRLVRQLPCGYYAMGFKCFHYCEYEVYAEAEYVYILYFLYKFGIICHEQIYWQCFEVIVGNGNVGWDSWYILYYTYSWIARLMCKKKKNRYNAKIVYKLILPVPYFVPTAHW